MERVVITGLGVLSALGSSPDELFRRLLAGETGVRRLPALIGTPIDVRRIIKLDKPSVRVSYSLQEIGSPTLADVLGEFLRRR